MKNAILLFIVICIVLMVNADLFAQDSSNVRRIGSLEMDARSVTVDGDYAYVVGDPTLSIVRIENPQNPEVVSTFDTPGQILYGIGNGVTINGDNVYVVMGEDGWGIIDVSDPENPDSVRFFHDRHCSFNAVTVNDENIYLSDNNAFEGLIVFNNNPENPEQIVSIVIQPWELIVNGDYLFVNGFTDVWEWYGLIIIDISEPQEPDIIGFLECDFPEADFITGMNVNGKYAFLPRNEIETEFNGHEWIHTFHYAELTIVDISNPNDPNRIGYLRMEDFGPAQGVAISGNIAYLVTSGGLHAIDITNPDDPQIIGYYDTPGSCVGVDVSEDLIYAADGNNLGVYRFQPEGPAVEATPEAVDFDSVLVNESAEQILTIHNWGLDLLIVSDITIEGDQFSVDFENEFSLEPDSNRNITVSFTPENAGDFEGTLTISSNDTLFGDYTVDLRGIGIAADFVNDHNPVPELFYLASAYPNPFNSTTTITYGLTVASDVSLNLYDLSGQLVMALLSGREEAGVHKILLNAMNLPSGVYFIRLVAAEHVTTQKIMLLR